MDCFLTPHLLHCRNISNWSNILKLTPFERLFVLRCSSCLQTLTVQAVTTPLCKFIPCLWYTVCPYFPRRGYAGFQLPERGLFGNHYGTQLLQVPTLNSTQNRMGQQSGGPAGLHGEGSRAWCASNDMHEEFLMSPRRMSERFGFQSFRLVVVCVFRFISACVALSEQPGMMPLWQMLW